VLTCWEPVHPGDERLRQVDLKAGLTAAGFQEILVRDRVDWQAREPAMRQEAVAPDPGTDPALRSFHDEGLHSLQTFDLVRRVVAIATAP
jgi:hypothetical protein